jgi:uncharacterized protein YciI
MKKLITLFLSIAFITTVFTQSNTAEYDKALADSLGADDYGMKSYIFVILKTGANKETSKTVSDSLFRGHLNNIGRLAKLGKLVVAGPLGKNEKTYRGIFILNVKTVEEANNLLATDPAIKADLLAVELFNWYGSAALSEYLKSHYKIEKVKP